MDGSDGPEVEEDEELVELLGESGTLPTMMSLASFKKPAKNSPRRRDLIARNRLLMARSRTSR